MNEISKINVNGLLYDIRDSRASVMGASGSNHASGLVPDPGSTAGTSKYLREDGTWQTPTFSAPVTSVAGKTGVVTLEKSDVGLDNVGNFKAVSTAASQGLTDTEKSNARVNIGAGTSSFSGSYNDLTDKPVIPDTSGLEQVSNKVTSLSAQSTDVQYPSAKCVYDIIGNVESLLAAI